MKKVEYLESTARVYRGKHVHCIYMYMYVYIHVYIYMYIVHVYVHLCVWGGCSYNSWTAIQSSRQCHYFRDFNCNDVMYACHYGALVGVLGGTYSTAKSLVKWPVFPWAMLAAIYRKDTFVLKPTNVLVACPWSEKTVVKHHGPRLPVSTRRFFSGWFAALNTRTRSGQWQDMS